MAGGIRKVINRRLLALVATAGGLAVYGLWGDQQGLIAHYWKGESQLAMKPPATGSEAPRLPPPHH